MGSASSTINRLEKENRALENELANIRYQLKMKDLEIEASLKMV
jgi:ribosomal protein L29